MSDKNSLNEKYQKFEPENENTAEEAAENSEKIKKPKKEKKAKQKKEKQPKEPKAPKEKKEKEPKAPKEKKTKEPKEPKPPKEKKTKEPKAHKAKKHTQIKEREAELLTEAENNAEVSAEVADELQNTDKIELSQQGAAPQTETAENTDLPETAVDSEAPAPSQDGRQREEIVFGGSENGKKSKKKKPKKAKAPKEKKVKEPKAPKEKKVKEKKEKKPHDPLEKKDYVTIILCAVAVLLAACVGFFAYFNSRPADKKAELVSKLTFLGKIFPEYAVNGGNNGTEGSEDKLSSIQIARDGVLVNLIQTDFPRIFYGINTDYTIQYYQYSDKKMIPVKYTDSINLKVDMGSGILNVKMNYIKNGEYVSGMGVFAADNNDDTNYFYNLVVFKLTVLPPKYSREGHALLLATTDRAALDGGDVLWSESFDVNLNDGSMTRFLSVVNRTIDSKGAGVADFCMLNKAGYTSLTQKVPFISSREYPVGAGMQDIFVKNGNKEELLASGIYGKYFTQDANKIVYLRRTTTGFDVIHNINGEEKVERSFYGTMQSGYAVNREYLLSKSDGHLYNIATGKDYSLVGYAMNAYSFEVSPNGRYVIMMGTVKNAVDYQIHIFDLQTGEYAKFHDKNYAPHSSLCFIDNTTVLYTAIDPNQGYEYVVLDAEKAFK